MLSYTWKTLLIWSWRKFHFFWAGTDTKNLRYYPEESYCCMLLWIILIFSSVSVIHTCGVKYMTGVVDSGFLIQSKQVSFTPRIWFFSKVCLILVYWFNQNQCYLHRLSVNTFTFVIVPSMDDCMNTSRILQLRLLKTKNKKGSGYDLYIFKNKK